MLKFLFKSKFLGFVVAPVGVFSSLTLLSINFNKTKAKLFNPCRSKDFNPEMNVEGNYIQVVEETNFWASWLQMIRRGFEYKLPC